MRTEMVFVPVSVHRSAVVVVCLRYCRLLGSVQGAAESEVAEQSLLFPPVPCLFIILHLCSPLSSLLHAEIRLTCIPRNRSAEIHASPSESFTPVLRHT